MSNQRPRVVTTNLLSNEDLDAFDYIITHYSQMVTPSVSEIVRQLIRAEYKRLKEKEANVL